MIVIISARNTILKGSSVVYKRRTCRLKVFLLGQDLRNIKMFNEEEKRTAYQNQKITNKYLLRKGTQR